MYIILQQIIMINANLKITIEILFIMINTIIRFIIILIINIVVLFLNKIFIVYFKLLNKYQIRK